MPHNHTILGAAGIIGQTLATELRSRGIEPRLVGRGADGPQQIQADLLNLDDAGRAVEGADVVHFAVGLPYDDQVWESQFPAIMQNVVAALEGSRTRLVFMDNVYAYGKVNGPQTETAPLAATTRKGRARKAMLDLLCASDIDYVIARSADFYGPGANATGLLNLFILANLKAGQPATWLGSVDLPHAFTYTRDIARAMAILAEAEDVRGSAWHVPTARALTLRELATLGAQALGADAPAFQVLDRATVDQYAQGDAAMAATAEMFYQFDSPYLFDSSLFERRFGVEPTPYEKGVKETVAALA